MLRRSVVNIGRHHAPPESVSREITETVTDGMRLGRHVWHDVRSRMFPAPVASQIVSVRHTAHGLPLDQGATSSCTGNATVGALMSDPLYRPGRNLDEREALAIYSTATTFDPFPGSYPPDDTGSTGLAAMKAAQDAGLIRGYSHAFGITHALRALVLGPVITGVPWYEGMDSPDLVTGLVYPTGQVRGGHEFVVDEIDAVGKRVYAWNSWGSSWGLGGRFAMSWDSWAFLLTQSGDVTVPHL